MASFLMTPGVYFQEIDLSIYLQNLSTSILAVVTTASRGRLDKLFEAGSYQQALDEFGVPSPSYPGLQVAREFFKASGSRVWMVRVANGAVAASVNLPVLNLVASTITVNAQAFTVAAPTVTFTLSVPNVTPGSVEVNFGGNEFAEDDGAGNLVFFKQLNLVTVGGTITAADVINVTVTNAGLTAGSQVVSYTVINGDTLSTVAAALAAAINANASCIANFITATSAGPVITVTTNNASVTTFSYTIGGNSETISFGGALTTYAAWTGTVNYTTGVVTINAVGLGGTQTILVNIVATANGSIVMNSADKGSYYNNVTLAVSYGNQRSQTISQTISVLQQAGAQNFTIQSVGVSAGTVSVAGSVVTGSGTGWTTAGLAPGMQIGFGSTNPALIANFFTIVSINSDTSITIKGSAGVYNAGTPYIITNAFVPLTPGTVVVKFAGVTVATDDSAGNLVFTGLQATWFTGTVNYYTGTVKISCSGTNAGTGHITSTTAYLVTVSSNFYSTFTLQVLFTNYDPNGNLLGEYVMESFPGLTLPTFVARLAASNIVTPAVLTAPGWFPKAGRYVMTGGDDGTASITDADYIGNTLAGATGLQLLGPKKVDCNVIAVPGRSSTAAVRAAMLEIGQARQDSIIVLDPPSNVNKQTVVDWADGVNAYATYGVVDDNRAAIYYPAWTTYNPLTNANETVPPSGAAVQAFARCAVAQAPAGLNRGKVAGLLSVADVLSPGDREYLYANRINVIADIDGSGVCVWGQKTATKVHSSLDRIGARQVLMWIEKSICTTLYKLLMEQADQYTYVEAVNIIQPYLNGQVASRHIRFGQIFCSELENPPDVVNNNMMVANVQLILPKYAEIIIVNFIVNEVGATITENIGNIPLLKS